MCEFLSTIPTNEWTKMRSKKRFLENGNDEEMRIYSRVKEEELKWELLKIVRVWGHNNNPENEKDSNKDAGIRGWFKWNEIKFRIHEINRFAK